VKQQISDALKPIVERLDKLEENDASFYTKEEEHVSQLLKPLASKFDDIQDDVKKAGQKSAGLNDEVDDIKDSVEDATETTKDVKSKVENIEDAVEKTQKDTAGLKKGVSGAVKDVKGLSAKMEKSLDNVASKADVKDVASSVKDITQDQLEEAAKMIKGNVAKVLKGAGDPSAGIKKTVEKNQKYRKRIYKDLHFHPH